MTGEHHPQLKVVADPATQQLLTEAIRYVMSIEHGSRPAASNLSQIDRAAFLAAVRRQRMEIFLSPHLEDLRLPDEVCEQISAWAGQLKMRAMSCAVATREVWAALTACGIDALIIKGIPLSLQTTGTVAGRGPGDVDLWVRGADVGAAAEELHLLGYRRSAWAPTSDFTTWRGRYTQWAAFELPMDRNGLPLDLHWQLAGARHGLPTFDEAWKQRAVVDIGGTPVSTLSAEHAFVHSCSHAHRDGWGWLRSLIDIDRLSRLVTFDPATARSSRAVRLSTAMAYDVTGSASLGPWMQSDSPAVKRARRIAHTKQSDLGWSVAGAWTVQSTWDWLHQSLQLTGNAGDICRVLSSFALPPEFFVEPSSDGPVPVPRALLARFGKMARRVSHQE